MQGKQIAWRAPEFEYHEKTAAWYWTTVLIALIILAFALWQQNFLFAVFVIIAEVLLVIWAEKKPEVVEFVVGEKSIQIGGKRNYSYSELEHYAVDEESDPDFTRIIFKSKHRTRVKLDMIIPKALADEVLDFLVEEAPGLLEVDFEVNFLDALERFLKF
ncbi:MAG: hypothetical protein AAB787_03155 [Patescibacteria group bacterium]